MRLDSGPPSASVSSGRCAKASRSGRPLYHDPALLSRSYARLLDDKDVPEALLAEAVRSHSRDYPRPVPVEFFEKPPFNLAPQDLADPHALLTIAEAFTTTVGQLVGGEVSPYR